MPDRATRDDRVRAPIALAAVNAVALACFLTAAPAYAGSTATLICQTASSVFDRKAAVQIRCSGSMAQCEAALREALKKKYGQFSDYDAQNRACKDALGGAYYPNTIKTDY